MDFSQSSLVVLVFDDKIIIFLRRTEDWENLASVPKAFNIGSQIIAWNRAFDMSYCKFRHMIKQIAMKSWEGLSDNIWHGSEERLFRSIRDDQIIVPTDDDDWFSPHLRNHLLNRSEDVLIWKSFCHQTFLSHKLESRWNKNLGSNEYAIRGSVFKRLSFANKIHILHAHGSVKNLTRGSSCNTTKLFMSCYNWHVGSASVLSSVTPNRIGKIIPDLKSDFPFLDNYPWLIWYFKMFCDVVKSIKRQPIKML